MSLKQGRKALSLLVLGFLTCSHSRVLSPPAQGEKATNGFHRPLGVNGLPLLIFTWEGLQGTPQFHGSLRLLRADMHMRGRSLRPVDTLLGSDGSEVGEGLKVEAG